MAGWGSLLISGQLALVAQWATFFAQWYVDQRTTSKGWAPKWYATVSSVGGLLRKSFRHTDSRGTSLSHPQYRFWLTSVVGGSILFSLAARSYYAVAADPSQDTSQIRQLKDGVPPQRVNPKG